MRKVLIVDDQSDIRRLLRLTMPGNFQISEATNADDALEAIRRDRPDAVILDVMMPGDIDGYQLCAKLKRDPMLAGIHVALVTARGQDSDRARGAEVGADAYFVKPFSPLALVRHLQSVLAAAHPPGAAP